MTRSNTNVDLCKLIAEFEINALQITGPLADGKGGSKPQKIPDCLEGYLFNADYTKRWLYEFPSINQNEIITQTQNELDIRGSIILSAWNYNLKDGMHTVYIEKNANKIIVYNLTNGNAEPDDTFKNLSEMFETKKFKWVVIGIWW